MGGATEATDATCTVRSDDVGAPSASATDVVTVPLMGLGNITGLGLRLHAVGY